MLSKPNYTEHENTLRSGQRSKPCDLLRLGVHQFVLRDQHHGEDDSIRIHVKA